jgi:GH15 family glucan-1,4-alpha-glucosidase
LSRLDQTNEAKRFFDWLEGLQPGKNMPLQVVYRLDGGREMSMTKREGLSGYRESVPVERGNVAADMVEIDSLGIWPIRRWFFWSMAESGERSFGI